MTARRLPVPITFLVVVSAVIVLVIFFGAWAVSANAGEGTRTLAFGFAGGSSNLSGAEQPGLGEEVGAAGDPSDKWWQTGFLKACPFH